MIQKRIRVLGELSSEALFLRKNEESADLSTNLFWKSRLTDLLQPGMRLIDFVRLKMRHFASQERA